MAPDDCPVQEVGEALRPYIKPRHEVAAIRNDLHHYLAAQLQTDGLPLHATTLLQPLTTDPGPPPPSLSGVRKAYWKALQAHAQAQSKCDSLRAELEQLKHRRSSDVPGVDAPSAASVNETYIPLLRQKEKQRKLKAVESAYLQIHATGEDLSSTSSVDDVVKKHIGELPNPPSAQLPFGQPDSEAEAKILELKKALISSTHRADERRKDPASSALDRTPDFSPRAQIAGLQAALHALTTWMETQLATISSTEPSTPATEHSTTNNSAHPTPRPADIEKLYTKYIEARKRLTALLNNPPTPPPESNTSTLLQSPTSTQKKDPTHLPSSAPEIILSHLPTLTKAKQKEHHLTHQTALTRRHLALAEAETARLMQRLADESHLVEAGRSQTPRGEEWARAAKEAGDATAEFVRGRVQVGEKAVGGARGALEEIEGLPGVVERVL